MPDLQYLSPYTDAANFIGGIGPGLMGLQENLQRLRYERALAAARFGLEQQRFALQQQNERDRRAVQQAQVPYYNSRTKQSDTVTALNQGKLESANALADAIRMQNPADLTQGPTVEAAKQLNLGDIRSAAARSAALSGDAIRLLLPHNVGANAISTDALTGGLQAQGPIQLSAGGYYQLPGLPAVEAPSYGNVGPGQERVANKTGQVVAKSPYGPASHSNLGAIGNLLGAERRQEGELGSRYKPPFWRPNLEQALGFTLQDILNGQNVQAPLGGGPTNASAPPNPIDALRAEAIANIQSGLYDANKVREIYTQKTGKPADF